MAEQTEIPGSRLEAPDEDVGRIAPSRTGRLVLILVALVLFAEIAPMQLSMVSSILPKLGPSFPAAGAGVTWASTIVGVAGGATMALLGKLGDLIGKKKVTLLSGGLFLIGALLCVLTSSWPLFLVGRALGGASWALTALEYGLVRDLMPRRWIPIAVGVLGTGFGVGGVVAPVVAGALTDHYSWRSIFWFLLIYTVVVIPLLTLCVPESPYRVKQRLDVVGAVLFGVSIATVLVYVSMGSSWGWTNGGCLAYLIGGLVAFAAFLFWEQRTPEPMMELSLLRKPRVSFLMAIAFLVTLAITGISTMIFYMFETPVASVLKGEILAQAAAKAHVPVALVAKAVTFRGSLSYANGFSILQVALHITVWSAVFGIIFGFVGGFVCRKIGCRTPLIISGASLLIACALWVAWHTTWQEQLSIGVLYGISFGFYYAANPSLLMDVVPASRQGVSAGMLAVWGSIGTSVATAIFTAVVAAHPFQIVANDLGHIVVSNVPQVYTNTGYSWAYVAVGVIPAVLALALALALRAGRTPARGGAAETTETVTEAAA